MLNSDGAYCAYLRKSRTDREAELHGEGETLARHRTILSEWAEKVGIHISQFYSEVVSGDTITARPEMQRLLHDVEAGMWDGVLVVEIERLARGNTRDQGIVADTFKYSNTLILTPFKIYNPNDEFDEEYFEFGLFMSRREFKTISRRLVRGRVTATKEGKFAVGVAPFGYKKVKIPRDKGYTLEIDPERAPVVRQIFEWYCYGERQEDGSLKRLGLQTIVDKLDAMDIKPLIRDTWSRSSIADMLKNPAYAGYVTFGRKKARKVSINGKIRTVYECPEEYTLARGLHEPIISSELFELAKEIRSLNKKHSTPKPKELQNPLSHLVYCSNCGKLMTRLSNNSRNRFPTIKCPTRSCPTVSTPISLVEHEVLSFLQEWLDSYELSTTAAASPFLNELAVLESSLKKQQSEINNLQGQMSKTFDLLEQGIYDIDVFRERQKAIQIKIDNLSRDIQDTNNSIIGLQRARTEKEEIIPKLTRLLDTYNTNTAQVNNEILLELIDRIIYTKDTPNKKGDALKASFSLEIFPKVPK